MGIKVGIQMYSVRNGMAKDPVTTIGQVAEIGYKYIELANLNAYEDFGCGFGAEPEALNRAIKPFGARIISAHVDPLDEKNVDKVLEYHARLGTEYIMSKSIDVTYEGVVRQCETLNLIGEKCKRYGIKNCLHTGVVPTLKDGRDILDIYSENTDADSLRFEFDTYWSLRSGLDPVSMIKKHGARIELLHQKDLPADCGGLPVDIAEIAPLDGEGLLAFYHKSFDASQFAEIGTGVMDLQGIIDAAAKYTQAKYIVLEQDFTKLDEMDSIKLSMEGFRKSESISWD